MQRYQISLAAAVCCAICLHLIGGEIQEEAARAPELITREPAPLTAAPAIAEPEQEESKVTAVAEEDQPVEEEALAFEPPFPDRMDLFQAPKRHGRSTSKSSGQSETSVELLGFVDVDGPRVALAIGGLVTTIAEGDQQYGIEVISIQPPAVVLQRGRQRWQASFEN